MKLEHTDMVFLFFVYGLASFVMGLILVFELRRASITKLSSSLRFLAAFGILHGLAQWVVMLHLVYTGGTTVVGNVALRVLFLTLSTLSALALIQFGTQLIAGLKGGYRWLRWLPWGLSSIWLASFILPHASGAYAAVSETSLPATQQCLGCHWSASSAYVMASTEWLTSADVWSRYLLFLPGSVMAAVGLLYQSSQFRAQNLPKLARQTIWAALAFLFSGLVTGMVVPPAPYPPASVLNYATVTSRLGLPPQVLWVISAAAIAFFMVRVLSFFEIERRRQLQTVVTEERERIAREMHDGLAQALGYLGMKASWVKELLAQGELARVREELSAMEAAAEEAYKDVRASILDLRSADVTERGLTPSLREYLSKFSLESGIEAQLTVAEPAPEHLSPVKELQLIRIIQEALANVRKHAQANRVEVRLEHVGSATVVTVADDGRGFSLAGQAQRPGAHFGLQTMRERAESLGGRLNIETAPQAGTKVIVEVPNHSRGD